MKRFRTLSIAFTGLVAIAAAAPQASTVLRRSFKADTTDVYKVDERVQETVKSPLGEMPVVIAAAKTLTVRTLKVDEAAGNARFEVTTTTDKREAQGQVAAMLGDKPAPTTEAGKIDVRGRVTFDKSPSSDALASLLSGNAGPEFSSRFIEFPEKAVKVGDSWDISVPKNPLINEGNDQNIQATLTGEKEVDGVSVWTVTLKGKVAIAIDTTKLPPSKAVTMAMRVSGTIDLTGEGYVEKSSGRTISLTTVGRSKTSIELVQQGVTLDTEGTIESTSKLQKPVL